MYQCVPGYPSCLTPSGESGSEAIKHIHTHTFSLILQTITYHYLKSWTVSLVGGALMPWVGPWSVGVVLILLTALYRSWHDGSAGVVADCSPPIPRGVSRARGDVLAKSKTRSPKWPGVTSLGVLHGGTLSTQSDHKLQRDLGQQRRGVGDSEQVSV